MASHLRKKITPVLKLTKDGIDRKIVVRVCRKYKVLGHGNVGETVELLLADIVELLLADMDGERIKATIKSFLIEKFDRHLNEGDLIFVQKFSVIDRPRNYPITAHPYKIVFLKDTFFGPSANRRFLASVFKFRPFQEIKESSHRDDIALFDVVGHVVVVDSKRMAIDVVNKSVNIVIEDAGKNKLLCVLWAPYAQQFESYMEHYMRAGRYCGIIIQLCRSKIMRGGGIGISNTYSPTKLVLSQDLYEIVDFISKLPPDESCINFDVSQLSGASAMSVSEELDSSSTTFVTLKGLKAVLVPQKVWIVASIAEVMFERDWSCTSCLKCKKKVCREDDKLFCDNCRDYVVGNTRYKVFVNVVDGTGSAIFLLWNDTAKELIGLEAAKVTEKLMLVSDDEGRAKENGRIEQPRHVDAIAGLEAVFKVSIEPKHIEGRDNVFADDKICTDGLKIARFRQTSHNPIGIPGGISLGTRGDTSSLERSGSEEDDFQDFESPDSKSGKRKLGDVEESQEFEATISSKVKPAVKNEDGPADDN